MIVALRETLSAYQRADGIWAGSSTWFVAARNPGTNSDLCIRYVGAVSIGFHSTAIFRRVDMTSLLSGGGAMDAVRLANRKPTPEQVWVLERRGALS